MAEEAQIFPKSPMKFCPTNILKDLEMGRIFVSLANLWSHCEQSFFSAHKSISTFFETLVAHELTISSRSWMTNFSDHITWSTDNLLENMSRVIIRASEHPFIGTKYARLQETRNEIKFRFKDQKWQIKTLMMERKSLSSSNKLH